MSFEINDLTIKVLTWQRSRDEAEMLAILDKVRLYTEKQSLKAYHALLNFDHEGCFRAELEDVKQEVFVLLLKAIEAYAPKHSSNFFTYLWSCHLAGTVVSRLSRQFHFNQLVPDQVKRLPKDSPLRRPIKPIKRSDALCAKQPRLAPHDAEDIAFLVEKAFRRLRPRDVELLRLRYGFDTGVALTLEEIGVMKGITRERVRQICDRGQKHMAEIPWLKQLFSLHEDMGSE